MSRTAPIKFFSGRASTYLAEQIAQEFGVKLGRTSVYQFCDGQFQPAYDESVRGCTVFIIQSTFPPGDNLIELLMMVDAAKRASADKVVAVIPYFGFARQDRKDRPRSAIGAKLVANLLTAAGVDRIMTMDLHADQLQGFFLLGHSQYFPISCYPGQALGQSLFPERFHSAGLGGIVHARAGCAGQDHFPHSVIRF